MVYVSFVLMAVFIIIYFRSVYIAGQILTYRWHASIPQWFRIILIYGPIVMIQSLMYPAYKAYKKLDVEIEHEFYRTYSKV